MVEHICQGDLLLYCLGVIDEDELRLLEQHLLLCNGCLVRAAEVDGALSKGNREGC